MKRRASIRKITALTLSVVYPLLTSLPANSALHGFTTGPSAQSIYSDHLIQEGLILASEGGGGGGESASDLRNSRENLSNPRTARIIRPLQNAGSECGSLQNEYRLSCLAVAYKLAAREASGPSYRAAKRELSRTARRLDRLVSRNIDRSAPPRRVRGKTYRAVKKSAVRQVHREAKRVIQETETKLIRSSGSGERRVHYQRIAQAAGSTKRILRS